MLINYQSKLIPLLICFLCVSFVFSANSVYGKIVYKEKSKSFYRRKGRTTTFVKRKFSKARKRNRKSVGKWAHKKRYRLYLVKKGDTLYGISKKFSISRSLLMSYNKFSSINSLKYGKRIKIPIFSRKKHRKNKIFFRHKHKHRRNRKIVSFCWPVKKINTVTKYYLNGVKPIGILIYSNRDKYVLSAANGVVKKIGWMRGFGNYIIIKHKGKMFSVYSNLGKFLVRKGMHVSKARPIALLKKKHFHFQIASSRKTKNPLRYLPPIRKNYRIAKRIK